MPLVVVWVLIVDVYPFLAGGLEHEFYDFPYIGNVIIPTWLNHHPVIIIHHYNNH
jgi:hypothetical protein